MCDISRSGLPNIRWGFSAILSALLVTAPSNASAEQIPLGNSGSYIDLGTVRKLTPAFEPLGGSLQLSVNPTTQEALLAWNYSINSPPKHRVTLQRIDVIGKPIGGSHYLTLTPPSRPDFSYTEFHPILSFNEATGQFLLTTNGTAVLNSEHVGPVGRLISPSGGVTSPFPIGGVKGVYHLAQNSKDGSFLSLAYEEGKGIFGSVSSSTGVMQATSPRLDGLPGDAGLVAVDYSRKSNNYFALMQRHTSSFMAIEGLLLDHLGQPTSEIFTIVPPYSGAIHYPIVTKYDPQLDRFLVAYAAGTEVRGQFVSSSGVLLGDSLLLTTLPASNSPPEIELLFDQDINRYVLATKPSGVDEIRIQVLNHNGLAIGHSVPITRPYNTITEYEIGLFGNGMIYAAWIGEERFVSIKYVFGRTLSIVPEPATTPQLLGMIAVLGFIKRRLPMAKCPCRT